MSANFPASADDGATVGDASHPAADEPLTNVPTHSTLHQNIGLAIVAIENKLGIGSTTSTPSSNTVLTGTSATDSQWQQVQTAMIADDAVTAAKVADDAVTKVVVTDTTDATAFPALFESATGNLTPHTDAGLTYNASNATLTATTFVGALTGDASGSSGSCTGNAATASVATTVTLTDEGSDTTCFPVFAQTATGNIALETDASALTYNASNGTLSATSLAGTLTTAAQTNITSVGTLTSLTVSGGVEVQGLLDVSNQAKIEFGNENDQIRYDDTANTFQFWMDGSKQCTLGEPSIRMHHTDGTLIADSPPAGTGNDAEWAVAFGTNILHQNTSVAADKENISADLGTHLTAAMIDSVVPKMWNRITAPGIPEIGPIADEIDDVSPFLAAHGTDADGDQVLTGINKTAWMSLMTLALQDIRTRLAALEG